MKVKLIWSLALGSTLLLAGISWGVHLHHLNGSHKQLPTTTHSAPIVTPPVLAEVAADVNVEREKAGLSALVESSKLDAAAQNHCNDMIAANVYAHNMPDGRTPLNYILDQYGNPNNFTWGENNAYNYTDSQAYVTGWINSPEHRVNILNSAFTQVGYGICKGVTYTAPQSQNANVPTDGYLVVQDFATDITYPQARTQSTRPTVCNTVAGAYGSVQTICY